MMFCRNFKFYISFLLNVIFVVLHIGKYESLNKKNFILNRSKLNVDRRNEPDKFTLQQRIAKSIPHLPIEDLMSPKSIFRGENLTCAWYPHILDIQIQNEYWQIFYNRNLTYYIFGAYLDTRPLVVQNKPLIRILAMIDLISENAKNYPVAYCQIWFNEKLSPVIVPVTSHKFIWRYHWGHEPQYSYPHILTCKIPHAYKKWIPKSISLVAAACDRATNNVRVFYRPLKPFENKKNFSVCIKGLDFPYTDISHRLVEYIETLSVLGAQKIILYDLEVHQNVTKVLDYYQTTGFVEYRPYSFSLKYSNLPELRHLQMVTKKDAFRLHESIAYNDCIYRNMYRYKYIGVWDIDELPLPLKNYTNWQNLVDMVHNSENSKCTSYASLCFLCAYFPSYGENNLKSHDIPAFFYMLQHVKRVKDFAIYGSAMKCLHDTERLIATHNHFPIHFAAECRDYTFLKTDAQMNHYREPPYKENLTNPVVDKRLWRFAKHIVENSLKIYEKLGFFN